MTACFNRVINVVSHRSTLIACLLSVILANSSSRADENDSVHASYDQIVAAFRSEAKAIHERKGSRAELRQAFAKRDAALRQLVDGTSMSGDEDQLSAVDCAALACAYEYLRDRKQCVEWSRKAIQKDASVEEAYAPIVRSLLNRNQPDAAAEILEKAENAVPQDSHVKGLHYIVFTRYQANRNVVGARRHLDKYVDWLLARLVAEGGASLAFVHCLDDITRTYAADGQDPGGVERLKSCREQVRLISVPLREAATDKMTTREFDLHVSIVSGLFLLECELAKRVDGDVQATAHGWCGYVAKAVQRQATPQMVIEVNRAFRFATENSDSGAKNSELPTLAEKGSLFWKAHESGIPCPQILETILQEEREH